MPNHQITWEDAQQMPDDGMRYEAIGGELIVTPARGPPDLVIEVLSPGTARRDRGLKHRLYARRGVAQYWIVDPEADAVEVHRFGDDPAFERFTERVQVRLGAVGTDVHGEVDLAAVFRRG